MKLIFGVSEFKSGDILSVKSEDKYKVVKVLLCEKHGVHIRVYSNNYIHRPSKIDPSELVLVGLKNVDSRYSLGMGHLPISHSSFKSWMPEIIGRDSVNEDELDGYRMWVDGSGGFW